MRIILHEIRKILDWKILLILLLVNMALYQFLISFDIKHFPNGRPALDSYRIGVEMINKYGTNMSKDELDDFNKIYQKEVRKADRFLQSRDDFKEAGILSYPDFQEIDHENKKGSELHGKLFFDEEVDLFWELQERERLIEFHNNRDVILDNEMGRGNQKQKNRLTDLKEIGQHNIYPEVALSNFENFIVNIAITIIISVVLLIAPIFIRDRFLLLVDLQYPSKVGRPLYKIKVLAGLISAIIVMTVLLVVYFGMYSLNDTSVFFGVPISSFISGYYWYDLTFFQYIVLTIIAIYILGSLFALITMALSQTAPNFIVLIGLHVPILFTLLAFGLNNLLAEIVSYWQPRWFVPTLYGLLAVVSAGCVIFLWKREAKRDIIL